ncbi:MAG TPA: myo-inositol-1-phosphate synthase [Thermoprotei archaeon]|nr:myo-inositol-1-phosphate synthase [Thermoprotei archaeon]
MVKAILLGAGYVGVHLAVGLERIKAGKVEKYGIPLAKYKLPYDVEDLEIVATYDVDNSKVGKSLYDLAQVIFGPEYDIPEKLKEIKVRRGLHLNSLKDLPFEGRGLEDEVGLEKAMEQILNEWKELDPDVVVNVITTEEGKVFRSKEEAEKSILSGNASATQVYAYLVAKYTEKFGKKIAFVNTIPTPVANNPGLLQIVEEAGAVVFGDDGATGATPLTADLLEHLANRNRHVEYVVQFNIGGNTDFLALTQPGRNKMKETTKSSMLKDILGYDPPHYIKPTGYLEPLGDKKFVSMHLSYISFNGFRDSIYINARINDSPALAGTIVDLIRLGKIAADRGISGTLHEVNAFYMKKPGPEGSKNIAKVHALKNLLKWLGIEE